MKRTSSIETSVEGLGLAPIREEPHVIHIGTLCPLFSDMQWINPDERVRERQKAKKAKAKRKQQKKSRKRNRKAK